MSNRGRLARVLIGALLCTTFSGCGIYTHLKDVTKNAAATLENLSSLLRTIDEQVESGQLTDQMGQMLDDRIEKAMDELNNLIQDGGGYVFDRLDGTLEQTFDNINETITHVNNEILGGTASDLLDQLSSTLTAQTSNIGSQVEDIVVLTVGGAMIVVDKAFNNLIVLVAIILLIVALIVFGVIIMKRQHINPVGYAILGLVVAVLLSILFVPPARALMFRVMGEKEWALKSMEAKVVAVVPESFTIVKNKRIYVYGRNLDRLTSLKVGLWQQQAESFTFPSSTIIVASKNRIVLGNFDTQLGWTMPSYADFYGQVVPEGSPQQYRTHYERMAGAIEELMYPGRIQRAADIPILTPVRREQLMQQIQPLPDNMPHPRKLFGKYPGAPKSPLPAQPQTPPEEGTTGNVIKASLQLQQLTFSAYRLERSAIMESAVPLQNIREFFVVGTDRVFRNQFKLAEGDYALKVVAADTIVSTPQFFSVIYPPPPLPLPDIRPLSVVWDGGKDGVQNETARLRVTLAYSNPEQIKHSYKVQLTPQPATAIPSMQFADPGSHANLAEARTNEFTVPVASQLRVNLDADYLHEVPEQNENNNIFTATLPVKRAVYDLKLEFLTFVSKYDMDTGGDDEYNLNISVSAPGYPQWNITWEKSGQAGHVYNINESRLFQTLPKGTALRIVTSAWESDGGLNGGDDQMGSDTKTVPLSSAYEQTPVTINYTSSPGGNDYIVTFRLTVTRREIPQ
jgi:hypothetical protein